MSLVPERCRLAKNVTHFSDDEIDFIIYQALLPGYKVWLYDKLKVEQTKKNNEIEKFICVIQRHQVLFVSIVGDKSS